MDEYDRYVARFEARNKRLRREGRTQGFLISGFIAGVIHSFYGLEVFSWFV